MASTMLEKEIKIRDNKGIEYIVEVLDETLTKSTDKGVKWGFEYRVKDLGGERIGWGHFSVSCSANHTHMEDEEIYTILLRIGAYKVKEDIDNNLMPESKAYNINVSNCQE